MVMFPVGSGGLTLRFPTTSFNPERLGRSGSFGLGVFNPVK